MRSSVKILCLGTCLILTSVLVRAQVLRLPDHEDPDSLVILAPSTGSNETTLFAGGKAGVYRSTDRGMSWSIIGLRGRTVRVLSRPQYDPGIADIYAATDRDTVYRSPDNGRTWEWVMSAHYPVRGIVCQRDRSGMPAVYVGLLGGGIYRSTNHGAHWEQVNDGLIDRRVTVLVRTTDAAGRSTLFAGTESEGICLSRNDGERWVSSNTGLTDRSIVSMISCSNPPRGVLLYVATERGGVFRSENNGRTWIAASNGLTDLRILGIVPLPLPIDYRKNPNGPPIFVRTRLTYFISTDKGEHWNAMTFASMAQESSPALQESFPPPRKSMPDPQEDKRSSSQSQISGRVTDRGTGEPLAGANVVVAGIACGAATNLDGVYYIGGLPPGRYKIRVSYIGYKTQEMENLDVTGNGTVIANFTMPPMEIFGHGGPVVLERAFVRRYGIAVGVASSTWMWTSGGQHVGDIGYRTGIDAGGYLDWFDLQPISLITEVRYMQKGMQGKVPASASVLTDGTREDVAMDVRLDHLSIGILPKYRLDTDWGELYALAGLQIHIPVHSSVNAGGAEPLRRGAAHAYQLMVNEFRSPQVGASMGIGAIADNLLPFAVGFEIRYSPNLESTFDVPSTSLRNNSFEFALTISSKLERMVWILM